MDATSTLDFTTGALAEGLHCYRTGRFWEAHEFWEGVWLASPEPEKTLLQCLIQISAALHHLQRGNAVGATSLLTRALRRLEPFPAGYCGVRVEVIRSSVRAWLAALHKGDIAPGLEFPSIP